MLDWLDWLDWLNWLVTVWSRLELGDCVDCVDCVWTLTLADHEEAGARGGITLSISLSHGDERRANASTLSTPALVKVREDGRVTFQGPRALINIGTAKTCLFQTGVKVTLGHSTYYRQADMTWLP